MRSEQAKILIAFINSSRLARNGYTTSTAWRTQMQQQRQNGGGSVPLARERVTARMCDALAGLYLQAKR